MIDYDAYLERARAAHDRREPKAPDKTPEPPLIKPAVPFVWPTSGLALQGFACLYEVIHHFRGGRDIFRRGCFTESLRKFNDVSYGVDHLYHKPPLGKQEEGTLELADTSVGLGFRLATQPGHLEILDGRDQVSVAYIPHVTSIREDGARIIKEASLFEISSVYLRAMATTHSVVVEKKNARSLAEDAKSGFASESAGVAFMRALRRLENN
jgi:HK97 family phage prohead protease